MASASDQSGEFADLVTRAVQQDLSSLNPLTLEAGQGIASMVLKDSGYGYGSVQRIEVTLSNGSAWSAGVDGGHATVIQCGGSVSQDSTAR